MIYVVGSRCLIGASSFMLVCMEHAKLIELTSIFRRQWHLRWGAARSGCQRGAKAIKAKVEKDASFANTKLGCTCEGKLWQRNGWQRSVNWVNLVNHQMNHSKRPKDSWYSILMHLGPTWLLLKSCVNHVDLLKWEKLRLLLWVRISLPCTKGQVNLTW